MINPSITERAGNLLQQYKVEPYVIAADVYGGISSIKAGEDGPGTPVLPDGCTN